MRSNGVRAAVEEISVNCPDPTDSTVPATEDYYGFVLTRIRRLAPQSILLRGPAHLKPVQATSGSTDLDILVQTDLAPIKAFLKGEGFYRVYRPQTYLEKFRRRVAGAREPYTVDLYTSERWGLGFRVDDGRSPAEPRLACLLHAVADGKGTAFFASKQKSLTSQIVSNQKDILGPIGRLLWRKGYPRLMTLYLLARRVIRPEPAMILRNLYRRLVYRGWQLTKKTGLEVALLGVDGTGKTSVARALLELPAPVLVMPLPAPVTVVYMGPHDYRTRIMRFIDKHRLPTPFRQVAYRYDLLVRRLIGWFYARKGWIVIYDRHPAERFDPRHKSLKYKINNALERLYSWPVDVTFWLTGDHETIYLRKKEYAPEKLRETDQRYESVLEHFRIPFEKIDVTKDDLGSVTEKVSRCVLDKYRERISVDSLPNILKEMLA